MAARRARSSDPRRRVVLLVVITVLAATAGLVLSGGGLKELIVTRNFGYDRLVSVEAFPEMDGPMCELVLASGSEELSRVRADHELYAALLQMPGSAGSAPQAAAGPTPRPSDAEREAVAKRAPLYKIQDPYPAFAAVAVDPQRDEVVIQDENTRSILVYDRRDNTPPTAAMSEPKRLIQGGQTQLEYNCNVYIDPGTGDIYSVNNDTMNRMVIFGRDAKGDAAPKRRLMTPHTTYGIAVDEQEQEMFFTVQDRHAVMVFPKQAEEQDAALRVLQGSRTRLADPHGIVLDPQTGLIYVTNWSGSYDRNVPPGTVERRNFPVGNNTAIPGSGKFQPPSITVYRKDAHGDTPPLRMIQGPRTQLDWPTAIAVHPDRGELFVANDTGHSITVYPANAQGDVAPIRTLKGPRTLIKNPTGVAVDLKNNELWVANFGINAAAVFRLDASGDTPPLRVIRAGPLDAPKPMMGNPHTVAYDTKRDEILVAN